MATSGWHILGEHRVSIACLILSLPPGVTPPIIPRIVPRSVVWATTLSQFPGFQLELAVGLVRVYSIRLYPVTYEALLPVFMAKCVPPGQHVCHALHSEKLLYAES